MPVIGPLDDSQLIQADIKSSSNVDHYIVTLSTGVRDPLLEPGLPTYGSQHPIRKTLLVDKLGVDKWILPGSSCYVAVYYSSDSRWKFPSRNPDTTPGFKAWALDDTTNVIEMPLLFERPVLKGCITGTTAEWTYQWFRENFKISVGITNVERTLTVSSFSTTDRLNIEAQVNKLHILDPNGTGSIYYKFLGASVRQTSPAVWSINYRWFRDPGNAAPQVSGLPAGIDPNSVVLPPVRGQFEAYQVYFPMGGFDPCNQSSIARPAIYSIKPYDPRPMNQGGDISQFGARDLPGSPLTG